LYAYNTRLRSPGSVISAWRRRAQSARLAWQPFMHNPSLPHLLATARDLPTLLLWGREDRVVPVSAAEDYRRSLKSASVCVFDKCGHLPPSAQRPVILTAMVTHLVRTRSIMSATGVLYLEILMCLVAAFTGLLAALAAV